MSKHSYLLGQYLGVDKEAAVLKGVKALGAIGKATGKAVAEGAKSKGKAVAEVAKSKGKQLGDKAGDLMDKYPKTSLGVMTGTAPAVGAGVGLTYRHNKKKDEQAKGKEAKRTVKTATVVSAINRVIDNEAQMRKEAALGGLARLIGKGALTMGRNAASMVPAAQLFGAVRRGLKGGPKAMFDMKHNPISQGIARTKDYVGDVAAYGRGVGQVGKAGIQAAAGNKNVRRAAIGGAGLGAAGAAGAAGIAGAGMMAKQPVNKPQQTPAQKPVNPSAQQDPRWQQQFRQRNTAISNAGK